MEKELIKLLEEIKKLIVLQLVKGFKISSDEIGDALGVSGRAIRNIATIAKKPRKNFCKNNKKHGKKTKN